MKASHFAAASICLIGLAACQTTQTQMPAVSSSAVAVEQVKQKAMAFERNDRMYERLANVALPILENSVPLCEDKVRHEYGFVVRDRYEINRDFRDGFDEQYGAGERPLITLVARDTPAFEAGLVRGHEILAVNGEETRTGRNSAKRLRSEIEDAQEDREPITLTVSKDNVSRTVTLNGMLICDYGIQLQEDNQINAYANGEDIIFTVGMMRFAETDEELATVVGHEIAHNVMGHIQSQRTNTIIGGLLGVLVDTAAASQGADTGGFYTDMGMRMGSLAFSVDKEQEADYVGLYLMERGGFDSSNVANFWRRMGAEYPQNIERTGMPFKDTHPAPPERFLALQSIHQEIMDKRAAGLPLLPNMQK